METDATTQQVGDAVVGLLVATGISCYSLPECVASALASGRVPGPLVTTVPCQRVATGIRIRALPYRGVRFAF